MTNERLTKPNPDDPILQSWAAAVIRVLRRHRLINSKWFKVKTTSDGTVLTFTSIRKKKKIRVKFKGTPSQFMICQKSGGPSYPEHGAQLHDLPVSPWPLGFVYPSITYAGQLKKSQLYVNEMVDGEPYFDGDFIMGSNNNLVIEIEIEEEE